jgi:hypothetical protein
MRDAWLRQAPPRGPWTWAAVPGLKVVDKLVRYETSNDRELDRALTRLERMQERRRAKAGTLPKD